jgi:hypothetical protein
VGDAKVHARADELRRWPDSCAFEKSQYSVARRVLRHLNEDCETVPVCHLLHRTKSEETY